MRILLLADNDGQFREAAEPLERSGHEVVGCHPDGAAGHRWPCSAIDDTCPLDDGIDAAVALGTPDGRPDAGVGCVVRQHIPLVIDTERSANELWPFAAAMVDGLGDQLVSAVEALEGEPLPRLTDTAAGAVAGIADRLGLEGPFETVVTRRRRNIQVTTRGPAATTKDQRASLAQAAFAAVRAALPTGVTNQINVAFDDRD